MLAPPIDTPVTLNAAVRLPAAMNTLAGATVATAGAPLVRLTVTPPVGASAARVTVPPMVRPMPTSGYASATDMERRATFTVEVSEV